MRGQHPKIGLSFGVKLPLEILKKTSDRDCITTIHILLLEIMFRELTDIKTNLRRVSAQHHVEHKNNAFISSKFIRTRC